MLRGEEDGGLLGGLLPQATRQVLAAGQPLFVAGDPADHLYYLCEGAVKLFGAEAAGAENVVHVLRAGDLVGLSALVDGRAYALGAEVLETATVLQIPRGDLLSRLYHHPVAVRQALVQLGQRYQAMAEDLLALKILTPRQRLCRYLIQILGPAPETGMAELTLTERHTVIAARIGLTPENLSRAFARLRGDGVVLHHRRVTVADVAGLRRLAAGIGGDQADCADFHD